MKLRRVVLTTTFHPSLILDHTDLRVSIIENGNSVFTTGWTQVPDGPSMTAAQGVVATFNRSQGFTNNVAKLVDDYTSEIEMDLVSEGAGLSVRMEFRYPNAAFSGATIVGLAEAPPSSPTEPPEDVAEPEPLPSGTNLEQVTIELNQMRSQYTELLNRVNASEHALRRLVTDMNTVILPDVERSFTDVANGVKKSDSNAKVYASIAGSIVYFLK